MSDLANRGGADRAGPTVHDVALRYRSLFDQHPDAVFEFGLDGRLVSGNAALERLVGYSLDELAQMTPLPLVAAADRSRVIVEFERAARGEARTYDAHGLHRDGHGFGVQVTTLPIVVDGEVVGVYGIARDLTGERTSIQTLEESETRFRNIFAASASGIFMLDLHGGFVRANPALCTMLGFSEDELRSTDVWRLMHPDERTHSIGLAQGLVAGRRETAVIEARFHAKGGCIVWLKGSVSMVRWPSGAPRHPIGIVEDITGHKRAEELLRQSDALMRMAGSVAQLGGWSIDAGTRALTWSKEVHAILDFPEDATPHFEESLALYSTEYRGEVVAAIEGCLREGTSFDLEVEVWTATRRRIAVRCVGYAERDADDRIVAVRGVFQDISAKRWAAAQHRELTERLSRTLEAISDGVGTVAADWTITYLNGQAETLLGRPRSEVVGRHLLEVYPELRGTKALVGYRRALEDREPVSLEAFHAVAIGRWFEVKAYPSDPGIVVYFRDVTERIERERRWQAVAAAEQQAAQHLRELDHVKNTFLTAVSHELRTPVTVVQGMAQTLRRLRDDTDAPTRARIEDALAEHATRLGSLLDELLDLDRLARGVLISHRRHHDVAQVVRNAVAQSAAAEHLVLDVPDHLPAFVDPIQVERILGNLIGNAAKYAPEGIIEVRLARIGGDGVRIEVQDHGPGIPTEQLEDVFEPFHRVGDLGAKPGTGIGLTLVAAFARLHGGDAWAEPSEQGAHFVVELPGSGAA